MAQPQVQGSMLARSNTRFRIDKGKASSAGSWSEVMLVGTKVGLVLGQPGDRG